VLTVTALERRCAIRARSVGRRAAVEGRPRRLVEAGVATEPVLLDLEAHEFLLGEWLPEDLLQPDRVHAVLHACKVLRPHSGDIGIGKPQLDAAIVAGASDGGVAVARRAGG
jgi:hypothetical protein